MTYLGPAMFNRTAGTQFKVIAGYKGTSDIDIALERGEVDGVALSWASVTSVHGQKYANGDIIPVFAVADGRMKAIPDVPSMTEFGRDDAEKTFLGIYTSSGTIGRALAFPPGVPADRVAALRDSLREDHPRPGVPGRGQTAANPVRPDVRPDLQAYVDKYMKTPAARVQAATKVYNELLATPARTARCRERNPSTQVDRGDANSAPHQRALARATTTGFRAHAAIPSPRKQENPGGDHEAWTRRCNDAQSLSALLIGVGAMVACGPAIAQSYPSKAVNLIVPFPPAGVTDLNARILAKHLSKFWKQPVTVTNMPGGGGTKGTMFVLGSAKDGYTMMMSATGQGTQNPAIDSKLPYKWDEPTLVARTSISPLVFVVKGASPWTSLRAGRRRREEGSRQVSNTARPVRAASAASRCRCCSAATASTCKSSAASSCRAAHRCSMPSPPARPTLPRSISPRWVRSSKARS